MKVTSLGCSRRHLFLVDITTGKHYWWRAGRHPAAIQQTKVKSGSTLRSVVVFPVLPLNPAAYMTRCSSPPRKRMTTEEAPQARLRRRSPFPGDNLALLGELTNPAVLLVNVDARMSRGRSPFAAVRPLCSDPLLAQCPTGDRPTHFIRGLVRSRYFPVTRMDTIARSSELDRSSR